MSLSLNQFYRAIPKLDLHYHLLGGVKLSTMQSLAKKYNVELSEEDARSYYREYQVPGAKRKGGIEALTFLYQVMQEVVDYQAVVMEVAEAAQECGLRYIETFWNPSDCPMSYEKLNLALIEAADLAFKKFGVTIRFIPSINRETSPEIAVAMIEEVTRYSHPYVLGVGIDYKEQNAPVENFWKTYRIAEQNGLKKAAHCSEFGLHWRNVETGVELIGCDRIDHGYTIVDNPELTNKYAKSGIPFTVIPSNTYYLSLWPDKAEWQKNQPIRQMAKAGLNIIPCTDDWYIHNTDSANCYRVMVEELGFDLDGIRLMIENSIDAAWVSNEQKQIWKTEWLTEYDDLRAQLKHEPIIPNDIYTKYQRL